MTRRIPTILLTVLLVFSFFTGTGAMAYDRAPSTPKPTATPTPTIVKKNTASEIKEIKKYTLTLCDMENPSDDRFEYAKYATVEDWKTTKGFPTVLYKYPYNISCGDVRTNYSQFTKNKDLALSSKDVNEMIRLASTLAALQVNANGNSVEKDEYAQNAIAAVLPGTLVKDVKDWKQYDLKHKIEQEGGFVTNKSLIYRSVNGCYIVRGRLFAYPTAGSKEGLDERKVGNWYYADIEYSITPVKEACETYGIKQWTQNKYTIDWYTFLHGTWQKATKAQVEWYKKNKV